MNTTLRCAKKCRSPPVSWASSGTNLAWSNMSTLRSFQLSISKIYQMSSLSTTTKSRTTTIGNWKQLRLSSSSRSFKPQTTTTMALRTRTNNFSQMKASTISNTEQLKVKGVCTMILHTLTSMDRSKVKAMIRVDSDNDKWPKIKDRFYIIYLLLWWLFRIMGYWRI